MGARGGSDEWNADVWAVEFEASAFRTHVAGARTWSAEGTLL
jgi:hypothetical protein